MERELLFGGLLPLVCGPLLVLSAWLPTGKPPRAQDSTTAERRAWLRLWARLLPAAAAWAGLLGWALVEPDPSDEALAGWRLALVVLLLIPWVRAAARAAWALRSPGAVRGAMTVGLFRPQVRVDPEFAAAVDDRALAAAVAHEQAHVAHLDPLRIWLASVATDLSWPAPSAPRRLREWRAALERARDDEARWSGHEGADLAAAILAAARAPRVAGGLVAGVADGADLGARVQRLLVPAPPLPQPRRDWVTVWVLVILGIALLAGSVAGDPVVRLVLGGS